MRCRTCFPPAALALAGAFAFGQVSIALAQPGAEDTDEPGRGVARISVMNGDASVRRGDSGDWVAAAINSPLVVGDSISTGPGSRAEVQLDYSNFLRLAPDSEVRFTELEYRRYQMQVVRGTVDYRVLRDSDAQVEVSTPAVSVRPVKKGTYRVTVRDDGQTEITARSGEVDVFSPRGVETLHSGKSMLVRGTASEPEYQIVNALPEDEFDRWSERRDHDLERSNAYRYVPHDIYGAEDLDAHGSWVYTPEYGWVWAPQVAAGWAPYRNGRWSWVDWYGWTWVSYDPWGWAPYHYGRWFWGSNRWCWYPGGFGGRHYWSPALVAFFGFGGGGIGVGFGNVGWVPLAPFEPYHPWYGRNYYGGYRDGRYIDRSTYITNNININNIYRNARIHNGITAVNANDFSRGRFNRLSHFSNDQVRNASLVRGQVPIAPGAESLRFSDRQVRNVPRGSENTRFFSMRKPDTVDRVSFADQRRSFAQGSQTPGRTVVGRSHGESTGGWRSVGEPTHSGSPGSVRQGIAPSRNATSGGGGWSRFGNVTTPNPGETPRNNVRVPQQRTTESGSGWSRFGNVTTPNRSETPRNNVRVPQQRTTESGSGWSRFGAAGSRDSVSPNTASPGAGRSSMQVQRGDSNSRGISRTEIAPRTERPAATPYQGRTQQRQERIQVAPPVVRERPSAPSVDRGGSSYGGRISHGAPSVQRGNSGGSVSRSSGGARGGRGR